MSQPTNYLGRLGYGTDTSELTSEDDGHSSCTPPPSASLQRMGSASSTSSRTSPGIIPRNHNIDRILKSTTTMGHVSSEVKSESEHMTSMKMSDWMCATDLNTESPQPSKGLAERRLSSNSSPRPLYIRRMSGDCPSGSRPINTIQPASPLSRNDRNKSKFVFESNGGSNIPLDRRSPYSSCGKRKHSSKLKRSTSNSPAPSSSYSPIPPSPPILFQNAINLGAVAPKATTMTPTTTTTTTPRARVRDMTTAGSGISALSSPHGFYGAHSSVSPVFTPSGSRAFTLSPTTVNQQHHHEHYHEQQQQQQQHKQHEQLQQHDQQQHQQHNHDFDHIQQQHLQQDHQRDQQQQLQHQQQQLQHQQLQQHLQHELRHLQHDQQQQQQQDQHQHHRQDQHQHPQPPQEEQQQPHQQQPHQQQQPQ